MSEQKDNLLWELLDDLTPSSQKFADHFALLTAQNREKVLLMLDSLLGARSA